MNATTNLRSLSSSWFSGTAIKPSRPQVANSRRLKLKDFALRETIAHGGCSTIIRATSPQGEDVVVKTIRTNRLEPGLSIGILWQEQSMSAAVGKHRHIVDYLGGGYGFVVMERLEGRTLKQCLSAQADRKMSVKAAVETMIAVFSALQHIHEQGLIYNDLKPDNVFITSQGPKLLDFGFCFSKEHGSREMAGLLALGTPGYIAPEVLRKKPADFCNDLFAAGVIMFEALFGHHPFKAAEHKAAYARSNDQDDYNRLLFCTLNEKVPASALADESVPLELREIIMGLLAKDPEQRYQSAAEVLTDLKAWQDKAY